MVEVRVSSDNKYRALLLPARPAQRDQARHNQIANCKNADGISTILSIVLPLHEARLHTNIFYAKDLLRDERDLKYLSFIRIMFKLISVGYVEANSWS